MENNGPTQPVPDDDEDTIPPTIPKKDDDITLPGVTGTQIIKPDDEYAVPVKNRGKEEESAPSTQLLAEEEEMANPYSQEDLSFASKKELSLPEKERKQQEIDTTLQMVNPETLTDSFDIKKMKEVLEEFHDDDDQEELVKQAKRLPEDEGDSQLIELASKAINEQKPPHFIMNFLREVSNNDRLLEFLKKKLTVLIKLFSVATLRGDTPEDFYENWITMANVFALIYPSATEQKIHLKFIDYIKAVFPTLIERFFDMFDFSETNVPPVETFRYLYFVCRDIYFVYATPKQQLKTSLFLIQKMQPEIIRDLNSNNNINERFDPNEWRSFKHLFGLCSFVMNKHLASDPSFGISQVAEPKATTTKKTKRDPDEDDENPKKEKNPKIQRFFLPKDMDVTQTWILKTDHETGEQLLVREDRNQNQIATYCSHIHKGGALYHYLTTWKNNQKLCPLCQEDNTSAKK